MTKDTRILAPSLLQSGEGSVHKIPQKGRRTIGVVLPSSNRTVERVAHAFLQSRPGVDVCVARVPYGGHPASGYDLESFRCAAALLRDARPDVVLWNATRGALLGFDPDRTLCAMLEDMLGVPATTTSLATLETLKTAGSRRIGLIAQGDRNECDKLIDAFGKEGITVVDSSALGISDNFEAAAVTSDELEEVAFRISRDSTPDCIIVWSTNLGGYSLSMGQTRLHIPILDSATIGFTAAFSFLDGQKTGADA